MTEKTLSDTETLNAIERGAVRYLQWRNPLAEPCVHRWTPDEFRQIRYLELTAVALAAFSGMISGFLIGGLEIYLNLAYPNTADSWTAWLEYWAIFLGISILISIAEIIFLYWVVLWRIGQISTLAGLHLSGADLDQVIAIGLSRSALDIPDPHKPIFGIDPYLRVPRWQLWAYAIAYRLKIGATSFLIRVFLRRVLARAALRTLIPLTAIAIYSIWNALIIGWVMRASRIRAAGPIAIKELAARIAAAQADLDPETRRLLLEAVAEAIMESANNHPNFVLLLARLFADLNIAPGSLRLDWVGCQTRIAGLSPRQQDVLLDVLRVTLVLDGRPTRGQHRFLGQIHAAMDRPYDPTTLQQLYHDFFRGQGLAGLR